MNVHNFDIGIKETLFTNQKQYSFLAKRRRIKTKFVYPRAFRMGLKNPITPVAQVSHNKENPVGKNIIGD